jgi:hypothetical protein
VVSEAIIGVVVGGLLVIVGDFVSHHFRREERKSDRRREVREGDLRIVREAVDAVVGAIQESLPWEDPEEEEWNWPHGIIQAYRGMQRAQLVAASLKDQELVDKCEKLPYDFGEYTHFLELATGRSPGIGGGKEIRIDKLGEFIEKVNEEAPEIWRRTREILEEV